MKDLRSGTALANRYSLTRRLGTGGSVDVWLATDRMTRADVALKILRGDGWPVEALREEWQTSIRLLHPHIVRVFEFHDAAPERDEPALFSLQFIDGPSIGVLAGAACAEILAPIALIADALRYAHARDVVHRDVKAGNVLIDANGAPYLVDFGVAATRDNRAGGGSPIAASPQSLAGDAPSPADDIFALGGLVYELISGRSPYPADDLAGAIRDTVPKPLTAADGSPVPAAIADLVARMLAKDVAARPDAAGVAEAIRAAGIEPGPAPRERLGTSRKASDVLIEPGRAEPRRRGVAPDARVRERRTGLSPRVVGVSLAVLVALLLAVVFLLPETVAPPDAPPAGAATQGPGNASDGDEESAAAGAGEPLPDRDERVRARAETEKVLGQLVAKVRTLEGRAVERWGGVAWVKGSEAYAAGDAAYLAQDYATATAHYEEAIRNIDPLLSKVDAVFDATMASAEAALGNGDSAEALRLYELAVAISPGAARANAGLERARNLDRVLALTQQGFDLEREGELSASRDSFAQAVEIDPQWQVARDGLARVEALITQQTFEERMSEGLNALALGEYAAARAAFQRAQALDPSSTEPADGLLQVEQGIRLGNIAALEGEAAALVAEERWAEAAETYERILELDDTLTFANEGLARSREMIALHQQLADYIAAPDSLSADATMQRATSLLVNITRMGDIGPRLAGQRDELSRLLKRAATPLTVRLLSDQKTDVSVYKVGKLGTFDATELSLRPGTYVAVGSRPGYRDVRLEFRVAPEVDMEPVVVRCEEQI